MFICEETNECTQGKCDGEKCIREGDPCESPLKDFKSLYEYSSSRDGMSRLPTNKCAEEMLFSESQK
jgi:hypothetical protein